MSWEIVAGIIALVGFIIMISNPVIKLNSSIVKLNSSIENLQASLDRLEKDNKESHKRLWDYNNVQDKKLDDHEHRISDIEHTIDLTEKLHPELTDLRIKETKED